MSERKWRPQYDRPLEAGDVFGDYQVGEAFVVTYHLDDAEREYRGKMVPMVRVSAYFGVEHFPESATRQTVREGARYSPVSRISLERLDVYGEVIEEVTHDNGDVFPFDYADPGLAMADAEGVASEWQNAEWSMADFWNGSEDIPRD